MTLMAIGNILGKPVEDFLRFSSKPGKSTEQMGDLVSRPLNQSV